MIGARLQRLSLRLRVLLFFAALALAAVALTWLGLFVGYRRVADAAATPGFTVAGILAAFGILGVSTGIWLLFDENVAKPLQRLAAQLRAHAHAGGSDGIDLDSLRHLGDLGPAARAVTERLDARTLDQAAAVATATDRLERERGRLTTLLSEMPMAMILVGPTHRIVLYDAQAAVLLAQEAPPRLDAAIFDYLDQSALSAAHARLQTEGGPIAVELAGAIGTQTYKARLTALGSAPGYLLMLEADSTPAADAAPAPATPASPDAPRPLVYDFDLLERSIPEAFEARRLSDLPCVAFDTETTGLDSARDELVQIGAVRVLRGRLVESERLDFLVDPGRPIPVGASRVHGIDDAQVAGAPGPQAAVQRFHAFARETVLVAHNAPFDLAFLNRHASTLGLRFDQPILDTVLLSAVVFGTSEAHSLDALCARLRIEIPEAERHTALGDARATAHALRALLPMLEARGITQLGALLAETRKHGRLLQDMN